MRRLNKAVWPYQIEVKYSNKVLSEVLDWCLNCCDYHSWYSYTVGSDALIVAFKEEASMIIFRLKWDGEKYV